MILKVRNYVISIAGIHGPKPIGPGKPTGPKKLKKSRTSSNQDRENVGYLGPTRTRLLSEAGSVVKN